MTIKVEEELVGHLSLCSTLSRPQAFLLSLCQEKKRHLCSTLPHGQIPRAACDFHKFSFFFFPSGHLGLWKGVSLCFKCFSLSREWVPWERDLPDFSRSWAIGILDSCGLISRGVVNRVWCLLSCLCEYGQRAAYTPESHPLSPGQHSQCPPLTLFWARSFWTKSPDM